MNKQMNDFIAKEEKELRDLVKTKKNELTTLIMDNKLNKLKNPRSIFMTRKEIARILTVLRQKELAPKGEEK